MKLDANAVCYLLAHEFSHVEGLVPASRSLVDYPLIYDEHATMSGHVVLVPVGVTPAAGPTMHNVVCVCMDEESAQACVDAGFSTVLVRDAVSMSHLNNRMQAMFVRNERLDTQLQAYVDTYAGFQTLLDACTKTLGCSCALVDERYQLICRSEGAPVGELPTDLLGGFPDEDVVDLFMASPEYCHMRESRKVFAFPGADELFLRNVFADDQLVGMLAMPHDGSKLGARYTRFMLDYIAEYVEAMYARIGSFGIVGVGSQQLHAALGRAFRGEAVDVAALDRMLTAEHGEGPVNLVVLRLERSFTYEGLGELDYLARRIELTWPHVHCVVLDDGLFSLVNLAAKGRDTQGDFLQNVTVFARDALAKVGVSRPFASCAQMSVARIQATAALEQGDAENPTHWVHRFDDYALSWLVAHGSKGLPVECVSHPAINVLMRYDEAHGTELVRTLRVFMECRYNATEAAEKLFVARSTLLNRLARISEIAHVNLDSFEERIYLGISLALLR